MNTWKKASQNISKLMQQQRKSTTHQNQVRAVPGVQGCLNIGKSINRADYIHEGRTTGPPHGSRKCSHQEHSTDQEQESCGERPGELSALLLGPFLAHPPPGECSDASDPGLYSKTIWFEALRLELRRSIHVCSIVWSGVYQGLHRHCLPQLPSP